MLQSSLPCTPQSCNHLLLDHWDWPWEGESGHTVCCAASGSDSHWDCLLTTERSLWVRNPEETASLGIQSLVVLRALMPWRPLILLKEQVLEDWRLGRGSCLCLETWMILVETRAWTETDQWELVAEVWRSCCQQFLSLPESHFTINTPWLGSDHQLSVIFLIMSTVWSPHHVETSDWWL